MDMETGQDVVTLLLFYLNLHKVLSMQVQVSHTLY